MTKTLRGAMAFAAGVMALGTILPSIALADDTQKQKNDWRNIGIGAGVIAAHGLIRGNGLETIVGAAGAAYAGSKYEQERRKQAQESRERSYYHRNGYYEGNRHYYWYGGHEYYMDTDNGTRHFVR